MGTIETVTVGDASARLYVADDETTATGGVLVLHPWWGLNDDVMAYADRLAGEGYHVAAPDMFGGETATTIEEAEKLAHAADEATIDEIVLASLDRLTDAIGPAGKVAALGFSFGAYWSMWSPTRRDQVVASILYYGTSDGPVLEAAKVPVLGHFAEDDPYETAEWVSEFEGVLRSAGRDVVIHRYPGTGHWFAEPSRDAYQPQAAELAFERTLAFLRSHLG
ncbi:MAG: dienelactone hydrolase family protein [Chloroflexota bacterium]